MFHRIESEEVCERYITSYFVEGLDAFDGMTDLEYEKNLTSNEFVAKLGLTYELDTLLASTNVDELPPIDISDFLPFMCNMGKNLRNKKNPSKIYKMSYDGKGPSLTINHPKTQEELTKEEMEEDLYERIILLNEKSPIIKTLNYIDKHKKFLDSVLLDKLRLDREFELEEEIVDKRQKRVRVEDSMVASNRDHVVGGLVGLIHQCVLVLFKHNTPVGRPRKNRRKSKEEKAEMVKDGKLSRAYKTVTCMKCGNLGHNSRSCKGQKDPYTGTSQTTPSTAPAKKPSDAGTRKRPSNAPAPSTAPAKMNQETKKQCAMSN
ncbi:reverse transcriptase domain-containing protein [Tanacetum coccineum]